MSYMLKSFKSRIFTLTVEGPTQTNLTTKATVNDNMLFNRLFYVIVLSNFKKVNVYSTKFPGSFTLLPMSLPPNSEEEEEEEEYRQTY